MRRIGVQAVKSLMGACGFEIRRRGRGVAFGRSGPALPDQPEWINEIISRVRPHTMTSPERIAAVCHAVDYIDRCGVRGDIVECGVWKGGSTMAAMLALLRNNNRQRTIYLFDTFEGMPLPSHVDRVAQSQQSASDMMAASDKSRSIWAYSPLEEVRKNISSIAYPAEKIVFVKGRVEETLPSNAPTEIALLRLDTDWYESTAHELNHLYPRLVSRGVLIIDDYGHWEGAKKATDEYIGKNEIPLLLSRIDYTGRMAVKP